MTTFDNIIKMIKEYAYEVGEDPIELVDRLGEHLKRRQYKAMECIRCKRDLDFCYKIECPNTLTRVLHLEVERGKKK